MKNYRIAFFTADWNFELVESTLRGLKRFTAEHENVSVCVFDCFGKDLDNEADKSEYIIYDLPDLSQFDGILIQGNQIVLERARKELEEKVRQAGIPAVTIDCPIDGCVLVGIDNRQAQYDITEHLISCHGARRMVYLAGPLDNGCPEANQRLDGFLSACSDYGIPKDLVEVVLCTWRTTDGMDLARRWLREELPLPDAFVCANDEMALGILEVLGEHGIRIPGDVRITGFDNVSSAELSIPRLSTVKRDNEKLDYFALDRLIACIDGREERTWIPFEHSLVCSESCGCEESSRTAYIRDRYFHQTRFLKNFHAMQEAMAEQLLEVDNLIELMEVVEKNRAIFGCDNVYLCINDYYFDNFDKNQWKHDSSSFGDSIVLAVCGRDEIQTNAGLPFIRVPARDLLPESLIRKERFLVFYPLHYKSYCIGYLAMDGISEAAKVNLHKSLFNFLEIAFENVRKKSLLRQFNQILDNLYIHDSLTGLYNRFGLERFGQQKYDGFLETEGCVQILFADMNNLKIINDQYGHETGDMAIRLAAEAMQLACSEDDFLMRYGGDEFLMIASCREKNPEQAIQEAVSRCNAENRIPCKLSLSIGCIVADRAKGWTLDACIKAADDLMYQQKQKNR